MTLKRNVPATSPPVKLIHKETKLGASRKLTISYWQFPTCITPALVADS